MSDQQTTSSPFETIRHTTDDGTEYWSARELAKVLGYTEYGKFRNTIKKAETACEGSGYAVSDHFAHVSDMVEIGSGASREIEDVQLSRYACYLIVQNADPEKPIVALGQTYFAVRTREAELTEQALQAGMGEDQRRLFVRAKLTDYNKQLADAAYAAGVPSSGFAAFQDHGYRGLYAGETARDIAARKGLKKGQSSLDWMNSDELAANLFKSSVTTQKLRNDPSIQGQGAANQTHYDVGAAVRQFIIEQGATPPEQLPTPAQPQRNPSSRFSARSRGASRRRRQARDNRPSSRRMETTPRVEMINRVPLRRGSMLDKKAVEQRIPALMAATEAHFLSQGIPLEEVDDTTFFMHMQQQFTTEEQMAYLGIASWEQLDQEIALAQFSNALEDIHGGEGAITLDNGDPAVRHRVEMIKRYFRQQDAAEAAEAYWSDSSDSSGSDDSDAH